MNSSQKFLMFIAAFFMKVCAGDLVLNVDTVDLGEITPPTTYTVPTNTQISLANREDAEILSIFIGIDDTDSASFRDLVAELSSSRVNNNGILSAESASQKIANRVPTPYFITEEVTAISLNASPRKLSASCAVIEEEKSTTLKTAAELQADTVSGWPWWYRWLSDFLAGSSR